MKKKLIRPQKNRVMAGVCVGLAELFNLDPVIVRVVYVILTIFSAGFPGVLIYIILWILIPEETFFYTKNKNVDI